MTKNLCYSPQSWLHYPQRHVINIIQIKIGVLGWIWVFHVERQVSLWLLIFEFSWSGLVKNEMHQSLSPKDQARKFRPWRKPASRERISASVELCETDVGFLHIQLTGTNCLTSKMHKIPPDVYLESSRSLAKPESWNNPNLHCCAVFPTWQYCLNSHVWWM